MNENHMDIIAMAKDNENFRHVLTNGNHCQVVVMSIAVGTDIGEETHNENDQILVCVDGVGEAVIEGEASPFLPGHLVLVPSGTKHNFVNKGETSLKLYTVYAPAHHPAGTIHATRTDAEKAEY